MFQELNSPSVNTTKINLNKTSVCCPRLNANVLRTLDLTCESVGIGESRLTQQNYVKKQISIRVLRKKVF